MAATKVKSRSTLQEEKAIELIERSTNAFLLTDRASRLKPYLNSGHRYLCDAIWEAPDDSPYKGVCIEIQGSTWSKGKHGNGKGIDIDNEKAAIAQANGWLYWASSYGAVEKMLPRLLNLINLAVDSSLSAATDNPMEG